MAGVLAMSRARSGAVLASVPVAVASCGDPEERSCTSASSAGLLAALAPVRDRFLGASAMLLEVEPWLTRRRLVMRVSESSPDPSGAAWAELSRADLGALPGKRPGRDMVKPWRKMRVVHREKP
jgi:hypothetical protein